MKTTLMISSLSAAALAVSGCATVNPPSELVAARIEYAQAQSSSTARDNPAGLYAAKKSLSTANLAFEEDPEDPETRDFAYIALRRVQIANAQAQLDRALSSRAEATLQQERAAAEALARRDDQLARGKEQLEKERLNREATDAREAQTSDALAKISAVKKDERGTVLSLSGSLLFVSGKASLLPAGRARLDEVAAALMGARAGGFLVEGHTDAQGSDTFNLDLSERRAQAVCDYLVSRGVPSEETRSVGYGEQRPIAENSTPEGRADNRRVEIVVMPESMISTR